jgi:hypothetical protein
VYTVYDCMSVHNTSRQVYISIVVELAAAAVVRRSTTSSTVGQHCSFCVCRSRDPFLYFDTTMYICMCMLCCSCYNVNGCMIAGVLSLRYTVARLASVLLVFLRCVIIVCQTFTYTYTEVYIASTLQYHCLHVATSRHSREAGNQQQTAP